MYNLWSVKYRLTSFAANTRNLLVGCRWQIRCPISLTKDRVNEYCCVESSAQAAQAGSAFVDHLSANRHGPGVGEELFTLPLPQIGSRPRSPSEVLMSNDRASWFRW
jgi:hypothetical protein